MIGRVTGGIATSLLFSVFESWLVCEHAMRRNFPPKLLSYTFSLMFALNYIVAIMAGLVAEPLVDAFPLHNTGVGMVYVGGSTIAFDMAICILLVGGAFVSHSWTENFGQEADGFLSSLKSLRNGVTLVCTN